VAEHPDWVSGGSWGMVDWDYAGSPAFRSWWNETWSSYVLDYGVDGFRLDIADTDWELAGFDGPALAGQAAGNDIVVFGESRRYHFSQHDAFWDGGGSWTDLASAFSPTPCLFTLQFSCHDSGWESPPGNYYALRGSRAWLGYAGAFSFNIPVMFGGEEFDADPVSLPSLQRDLYGGGGPGGWFYGTALQWEQIGANASKAAMLADATRIFSIQRGEDSDVLHHDRCNTSIVGVPLIGANWSTALGAAPYARFIAGTKAVLVFANLDAGSDANVVAGVPLASMGMAGHAGGYEVTDLWGSNGGGVRVLTEAQMGAFALAVPRDRVAGGGLAVFRVVPL
jgi:hypothetical protein